ncbi:DUF924 family protein [Thauera sinica]|uniref:DUF924 family protein n=1 Tax=Thauera sinica TaxID=2665146 RepID=A0ABW1ARA2_9RHOO|nr:DUF924 family protein [Thauera sp. K11]ATE62115.1 hypothetical protein CCZ27_20980 [Thauera sp. K11]
METPDTIHAFWFGPDADDAQVIARQSPLWWHKRAAADAEIGRRFSPVVQQAAIGRLDDWLASLRGRLALVLVADQFPRNIWRGSAPAFAFDTLARRWARDAIRLGIDRDARAVERVFLYLPLEHSEDLADQRESVRLFDRLCAEVPAAQRTLFDGYLDYARRHLEVIERFGRFPHRNAALGRETTPAEADFLRQPGSSF